MYITVNSITLLVFSEHYVIKRCNVTISIIDRFPTYYKNVYTTKT